MSILRLIVKQEMVLNLIKLFPECKEKCNFSNNSSNVLSTKSLHATEILLIPNASNLTISLTLKTKAVTKCDSIWLEKIARKREKC